MQVSTVLGQKGDRVVAVSPSDSIANVAAVLSTNMIGAVLVRAADGAVLGVLSERDIVRGVARSGVDCLDQTAADLMTKDVITCDAADTVNDVMATMTEHRIRHVPVMRDGALAGVISIGDVVKNQLAEIERERQALRDYISTG